MQRLTLLLIAIVLFVAIYFARDWFSTEGKDPRFVFSEKYRPPNADYKYNFVDTNPVRRVSAFFDNCSPENMEDCKRNDPYKGLPKP
jgi:hypothetical protein